MSLAKLARALEAHAQRAEEDAARALEKIARGRVELSRPDDEAILALADALGRATGSAALAARLTVRWPSLVAPEPASFATTLPTSIPRLAFDEALRDLERRDPIGAMELARMGLDVEAVYGFTETSDGTWVSPHGFALARAADAITASKVRDEIVTSLRTGTPNEETSQRLANDWDWPAAYARTVVRTNVATAESAGRYREAHRVQEQTGARVGFRVETAGDSDVRRGRVKDNGENHAAMDGFVARVDDPVWRTHTPPFSWNCRCLAVPVFGPAVPSAFVAPPSAARFAPGFGGRADKAYSGG